VSLRNVGAGRADHASVQLTFYLRKNCLRHTYVMNGSFHFLTTSSSTYLDVGSGMSICQIVRSSDRQGLNEEPQAMAGESQE
jgi:hypothetical protein